MRDFRKFCRPNFSKNSKTGDPLVKLKCGEIGTMSEEEYVKVLNFFEIDSFIGEDSPDSPGNIVVINKETGKQATFSTSDYNSIKDNFEIINIVGDKLSLAQVGDIICYNSLLDINSIFTYSDWLELDDNWEFIGISGITTYTKFNTIVGDVCIKLKSNKNIKIFIKPSDYSLVNTEQWEFVGITAIESRNMSDNKVRILSLDYMDYNNPATGNSETGVSMMWGGSENINISYKTQVPYVSTDANNLIPTELILRVSSYGCIPADYFNSVESTTEGYGYWIGVTNGEYIGKLCPPAYLSDGSLNPNYNAIETTIPGTSTITLIPNRLSDFNGESNTTEIMKLCTVNTPVNSSDNGNYPAALCCSLYSKGGLKWYLPAEGELGLIVSNFSKLNLSRTTIGYSSYNYLNYWFWSSTLSSQSYACVVNAGDGTVYSNIRSNPNSYCRVLALCAF